MNADEFIALVRAKERRIRITEHAETRVQKRHMSLEAFKNEILTERPVAVEEKEAERQDERKFVVYYRQRGNLFHKYVVSINSQIYLITMMRVDKVKQQKLEGTWE